MANCILLPEKTSDLFYRSPIYQLPSALSVETASQLWRYTYHNFLSSLKKKIPYFKGLVQLIEEQNLVDYQARKISLSHFALHIANQKIEPEILHNIEYILQETFIIELGDYVTNTEEIRIKLIFDSNLIENQICVQFGKGIYLPSLDELPIGNLEFCYSAGELFPIYLRGYHKDKKIAAYYWGQTGLILGLEQSHAPAWLPLVDYPKQRVYLEMEDNLPIKQSIEHLLLIEKNHPLSCQYEQHFDLLKGLKKIGTLSLLLRNTQNRLYQQQPKVPSLKLITILLPQNNKKELYQWQLMLDKEGRLPLHKADTCHTLYCDKHNHLRQDNQTIMPLQSHLYDLPHCLLKIKKGFITSLTHQSKIGFGWVALTEKKMLFQSTTEDSITADRYSMTWLAAVSLSYQKLTTGWLSPITRVKGGLSSVKTEGIALELENKVNIIYYTNKGTQPILYQHKQQQKEIKPGESGILHPLDQLTLGLCVFQYERWD